MAGALTGLSGLTGLSAIAGEKPTITDMGSSIASWKLGYQASVSLSWTFTGPGSSIDWTFRQEGDPIGTGTSLFSAGTDTEAIILIPGAVSGDVSVYASIDGADEELFATLTPPNPTSVSHLFVADPDFCSAAEFHESTPAAADTIRWLKNVIDGTWYEVQTTAGSRPTLRQNGASRWYFEFDGTDDHFLIVGIIPATDSTVSISMQQSTDLGGLRAVWSGNGTPQWFTVWSSSSAKWQAAADSSNIEDGTGFAAVTGMSLVRDRGTNAELYINGASKGTAAATGGSFDATDLMIGARTAGEEWLGDIYGIIIHDTTIDAPDADKVWVYEEQLQS